MTGLFTRFKYAIQTDLHQLFDKKESNNPLATLNQYIREAEKQTEQTGKWLERQAQLKEKLEREYDETTAMLVKRTNQLNLATASEETDLIAFAQQEVEAYKTRQVTLRVSIDTAMKEYFELEQKFETMKHKIKDMKVRQLQLMGKENVTRAHHQMDQVLQNNVNKNTEDFAELEQYIDKLGQQIEQDYQTTSYEQRLQQLEQQAK